MDVLFSSTFIWVYVVVPGDMHRLRRSDRRVWGVCYQILRDAPGYTGRDPGLPSGIPGHNLRTGEHTPTYNETINWKSCWYTYGNGTPVIKDAILIPVLFT